MRSNGSLCAVVSHQGRDLMREKRGGGGTSLTEFIVSPFLVCQLSLLKVHGVCMLSNAPLPSVTGLVHCVHFYSVFLRAFLDVL